MDLVVSESLESEFAFGGPLEVQGALGACGNSLACASVRWERIARRATLCAAGGASL